jgi:5-(carboxyamino)imidazole ribonucleotide synthase
VGSQVSLLQKYPFWPFKQGSIALVLYLRCFQGFLTKNQVMKVGILGGGQLGRMLLQAAADYTVETHVLENDPNCPAAHLCHHFHLGNIQDYNAVLAFGQGLDAITIEIESVNIDALETLEQQGVKVFPSPAAIRIIKNKITQKAFYAEHQIPSPEYLITNNLEELKSKEAFLPAVHKIGEGGYDGKGVQVIKRKEDLDKGFDAPSVLEKMVPIQKELALIIAVNTKGETAVYPPAEMVFDPILNLLDYQVSPARIPEKVLWKAEAIALKVAKSLKSAGLFAVELFVDHDQNVWVNETAPRVHNSGHHSIEGNYCSQYHQLWRIILEYPLGNTDPIMPAAIVNLLGAPGYAGPAIYEGLHETLQIDNAFVHLYGKAETKPGRKMGHVTLLSTEYQDLVYKSNKIKHLLKIVSKK